MDFGGRNEVSFEVRGHCAVITFTRPDALNALTHTMVLAIERALQAWEGDADIRHVVVRGEGRAFCAGGDIVDLYKAGLAGTPRYEFFSDEYRVNAYLKRYPKPVVSLYDGIVMGGGVGISVHGSHRVFTENAVFAMPEVGIGFFPDVGGAHFLPRLPDEFGMCMALTGRRVKWGDALKTGLATNATEAANLPALADALCEDDVETALGRFVAVPDAETSQDDLAAIRDWFSGNSVAEIVQNLKVAADGGSEPAGKIVSAMSAMSPTSLCVAYRQIREGGNLGMDDCMRMEYRIVSRMLTGHDFYEGIRAAVIDKDRNPQWQPASLDDIVAEEIDRYFASLGEKELKL